VLVEFRNVATRPTNVNGLGHTAAQSDAKAAAFESQFSLLRETPDIFAAWKTIVSALRVTGKQVHDARLVAVCHVHSVSHMLTFNVNHFTRLASAPPGIVVLDPAIV
jgi:predicted nucleic acid-binding protein